MLIDTSNSLKKAQLAGILEQVGQALELTDAQRELAEDRYNAVGSWVTGSPEPRLRRISIYPHGSLALGTTVKPLSRNEFDLDLVCLASTLTEEVRPALLKKLIGDRLRENATYKEMLEEKARCWRLNYANEFHLDITPSIYNSACAAGGELVPDKQLRIWKPTNPKGYRELFERRAKLQPRMKLVKAFDRALAHSEIEALPAYSPLKGILRRTVQLAKRHRDIYFSARDPDLAPISIIVTTLASESYAYCVRTFEFETELDVLRDTIRLMPVFIKTDVVGGRKQWYVWNETTKGENFAEKWNADPRLAAAFYAWHTRVMADLDELDSVLGMDRLAKSLSSSFGERPVGVAMDALTSSVSTARGANRLAVASSIGLTVSTTAGSRVRANTFFGAE